MKIIYISIAVGFAQGLMLLLFHEGIQKKWTMMSLPEFSFPAYAIVLLIPIIGLLCSRLCDSKHLALVLAFCSVMLLMLGLNAGHLAFTPVNDSSFGSIFTFGSGMLVLMYVGLPFIQSWLKQGNISIQYNDLYEFGWSNTFVFLIAIIFTAVIWMLLTLWSALFMLLDISFFEDCFYNHYFAYPVSGIMFSYGISLGIQRASAVVVQRTDYFFRAVTILISFIVVLFLLALGLSGLEPLWNTNNATFLLLWLQLFILLFVNGLFQRGYDGRSENAWVRWSVTLALFSMPAFSMICMYALYLRIDQYGWTTDRIWAILITAIMMIYAYGYFAAAFRGLIHKGGWLTWIPPTNKIAAVVTLMIIVIVNSPIFSPSSVAVNSQVNRLIEGKIKANTFDYTYLRLDLGRVGLEKLQELSQLDEHPESLQIQKLAKSELEKTKRWDNKTVKISSASGLEERLDVFPAGKKANQALLEYIYQNSTKWPYQNCFQLGVRCLIVLVDLNEDKKDEAILFAGMSSYQNKVLSQRGTKWVPVGRLRGNEPNTLTVRKILIEKDIQTEPRQWRNIIIGKYKLFVTPE